MYSELLGVIRVTTARISIGTEHDLLDVVAMGLPKHHRRPAAAPPITSPDISWLRLHTARTRARRARPDCAIVESSDNPFKAPTPYGAPIPATILRLTEHRSLTRPIAFAIESDISLASSGAHRRGIKSMHAVPTRRAKFVAAGLIIAVATAGAIGVSKIFAARPSSANIEETITKAERGRHNPACEPIPSRPDAATLRRSSDASVRLTNVVQTAAQLLRVNGAAWGPQVAVGTELSIDEAFENAGSIPGDAIVAEAEWLRQAQRDGLYDDADRSLDSLVRHIESTTITDVDLASHLGPNWPAVIDVVGTVAVIGFEEYVSKVRASPPMRAADALDLRSALRENTVALGLEAEWDGAQELVALYFQGCTSAALSRREANLSVEDYIHDWDLAEALARDAVAAAFAADLTSNENRGRVEILARGLQIIQAPDKLGPNDRLTRSVDPNENLHPDEVALLELEDPLIEGE